MTSRFFSSHKKKKIVLILLIVLGAFYAIQSRVYTVGAGMMCASDPQACPRIPECHGVNVTLEDNRAVDGDARFICFGNLKYNKKPQDIPNSHGI